MNINEIKNIESKKYFELVLQSYYSKNYKASVLLLYNLLINDLYAKLQLMNENGYVNCKKDIEEIENILKEGNESKYSIVEEKIFDVYKNKNILNHSTINLLMFFKTIRNKCAHPFFFKENDYSPTSNEVYMFIIRIYSEILVVEAFFKEPYEIIKDDIENYSFPDITATYYSISSYEKDIKAISSYFELKYFKFMTINNFKKLFKVLLDLTISKKTDDIVKYQYNHFLVLCSMFEYLTKKSNISELNTVYEWSKLKDSVIYDDNNSEISEREWFALSFLLKILQYNSKFVEELKSSNTIVYNKIKDSILNNGLFFNKYWKLLDYDINNVVEQLPNTLNCNIYGLIIKSNKLILNKHNLLMLIKKMFEKVSKIDAFTQADTCFEVFLEIAKDMNFSQDELTNILEIVNGNRQFYDDRRRNRNENFKEIIELGYDLSSYKNLKVENV